MGFSYIIKLQITQNFANLQLRLSIVLSTYRTQKRMSFMDNSVDNYWSRNETTDPTSYLSLIYFVYLLQEDVINYHIEYFKKVSDISVWSMETSDKDYIFAASSLILLL